MLIINTILLLCYNISTGAAHTPVGEFAAGRVVIGLFSDMTWPRCTCDLITSARSCHRICSGLKMKVGFIGAGRMATALCRGFIAAGRWSTSYRQLSNNSNMCMLRKWSIDAHLFFNNTHALSLKTPRQGPFTSQYMAVYYCLICVLIWGTSSPLWRYAF